MSYVSIGYLTVNANNKYGLFNTKILTIKSFNVKYSMDCYFHRLNIIMFPCATMCERTIQDFKSNSYLRDGKQKYKPIHYL